MPPTRAGRADGAIAHSARRSIFATIECQERRFHIPLGLQRVARVGFEPLKIDPGPNIGKQTVQCAGGQYEFQQSASASRRLAQRAALGR
jgi:hypothetical protein